MRTVLFLLSVFIRVYLRPKSSLFFSADSVRFGEYVRYWHKWARARVKLQTIVFKENEDVGELFIDKCLSWIQSGVLTLICDLHTEGFGLITNQGLTSFIQILKTNIKDVSALTFLFLLAKFVQ